MAPAGIPAVGMVAPEFTLPGADGGAVTLSDVIRTKRALVVFYRGGWCPVCSVQIRDLARAYTEIASHDVEVLAISSETPQEGERLAARRHVPFPLLADTERSVIRAYGTLANKRDWLGRLLAKRDYAATMSLLIGKNQIVQWTYVRRDYHDRPGIATVLDAIRSTAVPP